MKRRNLFKPSNNDYLPSLSSPTSSNGYQIDGSGRGVHMDAPIVRGWKNSSGYTKGSYYWLIGSLVTIVWSFRFMINTYATTYLTCEDNNCILKIIPPNREKKLNFNFHPDQIITTREIQVTSDGVYIPDLNDNIPSNNKRSKFDRYKYKDSERFESYGIILDQLGRITVELKEVERKLAGHQFSFEHHDDLMVIDEMMRDGSITEEQRYTLTKYGISSKMDPDLLEKYNMYKKKLFGGSDEDKKKEDEIREKEIQKLQEKKKKLLEQKSERFMEEYPNLDELYQWAEVMGPNKYMIVMRKYNIGHRKRNPAHLMRIIMNYVNGKREKLIIRENRNIAWQGILGIVFGTFSILLCFLIGQFWEPDGRKKIRSSTSGNYANSVQRRHGSHLNSQGPSMVPRSFTSGPSTQTSKRRMTYGGYKPGNSTY